MNCKIVSLYICVKDMERAIRYSSFMRTIDTATDRIFNEWTEAA